MNAINLMGNNCTCALKTSDYRSGRNLLEECDLFIGYPCFNLNMCVSLVHDTLNHVN